MALSYGYVLVFLGSMIEGDATLLTAGFLAHQGHFSFPGVLLTAAVASTIVNETVYHLARKRSRRYFERKVASHPKYARVQEWIRKRSTLLLLFSRYIFGFRLAVPAACGMIGMRPPKFAGLDFLGALLWVIPVGYLGYAFGGVIEHFWANVKLYEWHIAVVALAIGWLLLVRYDPELRMVAKLFFRTREFALSESSRLRRRLAKHRLGKANDS